jgi:hypothetical protein
VYVQSAWPDSPANDPRIRRLLESVDGLAEKLDPLLAGAQHASDEARLSEAGFTARDIARLRRARDATAAAYFNEGVPLARLLAEGIGFQADEQD